MNPENVVKLRGSVVPDPKEGDSWTRWKSRTHGQVRFWLSVSRGAAGDGTNVLLCAVEIHDPADLPRLQEALKAFATVELDCEASQIGNPYEEDRQRVLFVARPENCRIEGHAVQTSSVRRQHAKGKAAAAGDDTNASLWTLSKDRS